MKSKLTTCAIFSFLVVWSVSADENVAKRASVLTQIGYSPECYTVYKEVCTDDRRIGCEEFNFSSFLVSTA
jgi:hypothetical protein